MKLCTERPIEFFYNNYPLVTFMATPENIDELALGFLLSRRLIDDFKDILKIKEEKNTIYIEGRAKKEIKNQGLLISSCNSADYFYERLNHLEEVDSKSFSKEKMRKNSEEMVENAILYKKTGGVHGACLCNDEGIIIMREDIGRHNTVDKIIGYGLKNSLNLNDYYILLTGRISSDMVLKAIEANISSIVSLSITSDLAFDIAKKANIEVVGRIGKEKPIFYMKN